MEKRLAMLEEERQERIDEMNEIMEEINHDEWNATKEQSDDLMCLRSEIRMFDKEINFLKKKLG